MNISKSAGSLLLPLLLPLLWLSCSSLPNDTGEIKKANLHGNAGSLEVEANGHTIFGEDSAELISQSVPAFDFVSASRELVKTEQAITGQPLVAGNAVKLLIDGPATFKAMFASIDAAETEVFLETFILRDDEIGTRLTKHLENAQARGVAVKLIFDGIGSIKTADKFFDGLAEAGIECRKYNPPNPTEDLRLWRINNRNHRKLMVVDGRTAFVGGINFTSEYSYSSAIKPGSELGMKEGWRDTHIQVDGPVAMRFRDLFIDQWATVGDPMPVEFAEREFPTEDAGDHLVRVLASEGGDDEYEVYASYRSAIVHARQSIWLTHAYFAPDEPLLAELEEAAQRGVDVRLLMPGFTDSQLAFYASRSNYLRLLQSGARIYERHDALLHAKTAVVDGVWSTIGSTNLDMRSFIHNDEVNAIVIGRDFGARMQYLFIDDIRPASEITLEQWRDRPFLDRVKEFFSRRLNYWL